MTTKDIYINRPIEDDRFREDQLDDWVNECEAVLLKIARAVGGESINGLVLTPKQILNLVELRMLEDRVREGEG